jgi:hypothetical protein
MTIQYHEVQGTHLDKSLLVSGLNDVSLYDLADSFAEEDFTTTASFNNNGETRWSPDNTYIVQATGSSGNRLQYYKVTTNVDTLSHEINEITTGIPTITSATYSPVAWARQGTAFFTYANGISEDDIVVIERTGDTFAVVSPDPVDTQPAQDLQTADACPTADLVAFGGGSASLPWLELYTYDPSDWSMTRVTTTGIDTQPSSSYATIPFTGCRWSPDGVYLAVVAPGFTTGFSVYVYERTGNTIDLHTTLVASTGLNGNSLDGALAWTPDSAALYVVNSDTSASPTTYAWTVSAGVFSAVTLSNSLNSADKNLAIDRDGTYLFTQQNAAGTSVRRYPISGGDITAGSSTFNSTNTSENGTLECNH